MTEVTVTDPFNNRITFGERTADRRDERLLETPRPRRQVSA